MAACVTTTEESPMLGAIIGDVIGSPFEHYNVKSTSHRKPF
jgi:ADP-ribosylglycohydrolase